MAIQEGLIKLSGKLGELVFYQRKKKNVVRQKANSYPLAEGTKKVGKDFGEASRNAAYIRKAFAKGVSLYGDGELINRLNKRFIEIFKTIPKAQLGNKKLIDGNLNLLKGFEFNKATPLPKLMYQLPVCNLQVGEPLKIRLPKLPRTKFVKKIMGAETCILRLMVFNFSLNGDDYEIIKINPLILSLLEPIFNGADIKVSLKLAGNRALVIAMGISYVRDGGVSNDKRYHACQIIEALHLRDGIAVDFVDNTEPEQSDKEEEEENGLSWEMGDH